MFNPNYYLRFQAPLQYHNLCGSSKETPGVQWIQGKSVPGSTKTKATDTRAEKNGDISNIFCGVETDWIHKSKI